MRAAAALLAAVAALAMVASARAAPPWSPPAPIPGSAGLIVPSIVFTGAGTGVMVATDVSPGTGAPPRASAALLAPGAAAFGPARPLLPGGVLLGVPAGVAPLGATGVAAVGAFSRTHTSRVWLGAAVAGRPLRRLVGLGPRGKVSFPLWLATDPRGDLAALIETCGDDCLRQRVTLLTRAAGGGPVRTRRVATLRADGDHIGLGAVALDRRGRLVVAYGAGNRVSARRGSVRGRLGAAQRLAPVHHFVESISAALTDDGTAALAWVDQENGESVSPARFAAAVAPPGRRFAVHGLERWPRSTSHTVALDPVAVVAAAGGRVSIGWTGFEAGRYVARVAGVQGTRVGASQTLAVPRRDVALADLAATPSGHAVALADLADVPTDFFRPRAVLAAERPVGAPTFGSLVAVSDGTRHTDAAHVAFDPVSGRAVAVWQDGVGSNETIRTATLAPM